MKNKRAERIICTDIDSIALR